jgi:hypothetical protein
MICRVLSLKMNDAAVQMLGMVTGSPSFAPPGGLAPGLRQRIRAGIVRRGEVLTWAGSLGAADRAPGGFADLTAWECADSSFHLEDFVPVKVEIVDDAPLITEDDQRTLLLHGMAFALDLAALVCGLDQPGPVRCILSANETNATFRFHQIRPGEERNRADLELYRREKMAVMDVDPTGT